MADDDDFTKDPTAFTALTKIHDKPVLDCCFSPNSNQILSGSEDNTVVLWNLPPNDIELHDDTINPEHKLVCYRLQDHKSPVMSVAIHRRLFVSASKDGLVKLWKLIPDPNRPQQPTASCDPRDALQVFKQPRPDPQTYKCHTSIIRSVTFSPNARCFATASDDKIVKIWSTECKNKMIFSLHDGHTNWIKCVRYAKTNDSLLASCGDDGRICIWDTRTKVRQPPCEILKTKRRIQFNCLDWHPVFEHNIATGAQDSSCIIWDLRMRKQIQVYQEHSGSVNAVAFNSGGSLLLSGSSDRTSKIFDVCEGRNLFTLMSHNGSVTSVCFNPTGDLFATGSQDRTITVWKRNFDTVNIVSDDGSGDLDESIADINYNDDDGSSSRVDRNHFTHE